MPVAIMIALAAASIYTSVRMNNEQVKAQNAARREQEKARVEAVRQEIATSQQVQNTALGSSADTVPSFAQGSSIMGGLPSVSGNKSSTAGSSGTF